MTSLEAASAAGRRCLGAGKRRPLATAEGIRHRARHLQRASANGVFRRLVEQAPGVDHERHGLGLALADFQREARALGSRLQRRATSDSPPRTNAKVSRLTVLSSLASEPTSRNSRTHPQAEYPRVFCSTEIWTFLTEAPRATVDLLPQPDSIARATRVSAARFGNIMLRTIARAGRCGNRGRDALESPHVGTPSTVEPTSGRASAAFGLCAAIRGAAAAAPRHPQLTRAPPRRAGGRGRRRGRAGATWPPGTVGTAHPVVVEAVSRLATWTVLCQARSDTNGDGGIGVTVGARGALSGDTLSRYLAQGAGRLAHRRPRRRDATGRWLVVQRGDALWLVDSFTRRADAPCRRGHAPRLGPFVHHRAVTFDETGSVLAYLCRRGGQPPSSFAGSKMVQERELDPGSGEVWRLDVDPRGRRSWRAWSRRTGTETAA